MPQSYNAFIFRLLKSNIAQDSKIRYTSIFNYNPLISIYYFHSMLIKVTDLSKLEIKYDRSSRRSSYAWLVNSTVDAFFQ